MKSFFQWLSSVLAAPQNKDSSLAGVRYFTGSWSEVLAEAERQNKPVFVDFYKLGFYPRKQIAQEAFLSPSLADKFNANFINYRVDDQTNEGLTIAKQYQIYTSPVPTSLYVLSDGSLLHRASGYEGLQGMLAEADKALEAAKEPNQLSILERAYRAGKRDPAFLGAYLRERGRAGMPNDEALALYLSLVSETDRTSDETTQLIVDNLTTYDKAVVNGLLQKLHQTANSSEKSAVTLRTKISECIRPLIRTRFHQAIADRDEHQLDNVIAYKEPFLRAEKAGKLSRQEADDVANGYRRRFYAETKNFAKYRPLAEAEAWKLMTIPTESVRVKDAEAYQRYQERKAKLDSTNQHPDYEKFAGAMSAFESNDIASKLNRFVRYYCENMTDPTDLNQALTWSAKSLDYDHNPGYANLHARLLIKLGRTREADSVLRKVSAQQTPGVYRVYMSIKRPEDYEL